MGYVSSDGRIRMPVPPLEVGDRVQLFWPGVRTARVTSIVGRWCKIRFTKARHNGDQACETAWVKQSTVLYHPSRRDILRRAEEVMVTWSERERLTRKGWKPQERYTIPEADIEREGLIVRKQHCY
jgi:hypothetical protein